MTPELRDGLFSVDPVDLGVELVSRFLHSLCKTLSETHQSIQVNNYEQEAAEEVKKGVIEPDEGLLSTLTSMGIPEHHAVRALQGTKNGSLDEVFNYIEAHENDPEFNKPLVDPNEANEGKKKRKKPRFIPIELQRLFTQLQLSDRLAVSTDGKYRFSLHPTTCAQFDHSSFPYRVDHKGLSVAEYGWASAA